MRHVGAGADRRELAERAEVVGTRDDDLVRPGAGQLADVALAGAVRRFRAARAGTDGAAERRLPERGAPVAGDVDGAAARRAIPLRVVGAERDAVRDGVAGVHRRHREHRAAGDAEAAAAFADEVAGEVEELLLLRAGVAFAVMSRQDLDAIDHAESVRVEAAAAAVVELGPQALAERDRLGLGRFEDELGAHRDRRRAAGFHRHLRRALPAAVRVPAGQPHFGGSVGIRPGGLLDALLGIEAGVGPEHAGECGAGAFGDDGPVHAAKRAALNRVGGGERRSSGRNRGQRGQQTKVHGSPPLRRTSSRRARRVSMPVPGNGKLVEAAGIDGDSQEKTWRTTEACSGIFPCRELAARTCAVRAPSFNGQKLIQPDSRAREAKTPAPSRRRVPLGSRQTGCENRFSQPERGRLSARGRFGSRELREPAAAHPPNR